MFTRDAYELSKRVYLENLCNCLFIFIRRTVMVTVIKMNKLCFTPLLTLTQGVPGPGVSKNPDHQTKVHSGELER